MRALAPHNIKHEDKHLHSGQNRLASPPHLGEHGPAALVRDLAVDEHSGHAPAVQVRAAIARAIAMRTVLLRLAIVLVVRRRRWWVSVSGGGGLRLAACGVRLAVGGRIPLPFGSLSGPFWVPF